MKKRLSSVSPSQNGGDFNEYARNCASISIQQQINLQTMRYKDSNGFNFQTTITPLTSKHSQNTQYQQQQIQQFVETNSVNKGLSYYLKHSNEKQTERVSRYNIQLQQSKQKFSLNSQENMTQQQQQQQIQSQKHIDEMDNNQQRNKENNNNISMVSSSQQKYRKYQSARIIKGNTVVGQCNLQDEQFKLQFDKNNNSKINNNNNNNNFMEDSIFFKEKQQRKSHNINSSMINQTNQEPLLLDHLVSNQLNINNNNNECDEQVKIINNININDDQQKQRVELQQQYTSFSVNSRSKRYNNQEQNLSSSSTQNYQTGFNSIRNKQHTQRKSECLYQIQKNNKSIIIDFDKYIKPCQELNDFNHNLDNKNDKSIIKSIDNKYYTSNSNNIFKIGFNSLSENNNNNNFNNQNNKSSYCITNNKNVIDSNNIIQERQKQNQFQEQIPLKIMKKQTSILCKNITNTERQNTNNESLTTKSDNATTKFNFDLHHYKLTSEMSNRNIKICSESQIQYQKKLNEYKIILTHDNIHSTKNTNKLNLHQFINKKNESESDKNNNINNNLLNINKQNNKLFQQLMTPNEKKQKEINNNYFQINEKTYNKDLKEQIRTLSHNNKIHKENQELIKTKMSFLTHKQQQQNKQNQQNENQQNNNNIFQSPSSSMSMNKIPLTPLTLETNISSNKNKRNSSKEQSSKSKSPFQPKVINSINKNENNKKPNKRGDSLAEQLEYEYNNMYFNNNSCIQPQQSQQQQQQNQNQINNQTSIQQNNIFNYNTFHSSPLIPSTITPSSSFIIYNNNNNNKLTNNNNNIKLYPNSHSSQFNCSVSTFTNLNINDLEEDKQNQQIIESTKLISHQKLPSMILGVNNYSMNQDYQQQQQQYQCLNCKEITNYFGIMRTALEQEIRNDEQFMNIIEKKLLINLEQFLYFLNHFWKFCIENFDKFEIDFPIFKIEEKYLNKILEIINNTLNDQEYLNKDIINLFINSFNIHSQRLILPKNLLEHIGGEKQANKLINDLINHLKYDISIGVQLGKILNEIDMKQAGIMFCHFLKDEVDGIKDAIVYANKELNVTQVEFFLIKQTIYSVLMPIKLIAKQHQMAIIEKFEKLRAFVIQDQTQLHLLQDQIIHEALMIKIRNTKQILSQLKNKDRQSMIHLSSFTFSMIFGKTTIQEYSLKLQNEIISFSIPIIAQNEIDEINEKDKKQNKLEKIMLFIQGLEELILETVNDFMDLTQNYNTEKHMKLKFLFLKEYINQEFPKVRDNGRSLIKELRIWAVSNFKKYLKNIEMTEGENFRLDIMDSILKYYFYRSSDCFSFYDVPIAINYFPITRNAIEYWLLGLKQVLQDQKFELLDCQVDIIIEQISSLFSLRWVKKKNQLFFLHQNKA